MSYQQTGFKGFAHIITFLVCELLAFILIINFNQTQRDIFLHSSSLFSGNLLKTSAQVKDYLSLQQSNDELLAENARLLNEIINMPRSEAPVPDAGQIAYSVIPARIINNNITSVRNLITIDKGSRDSIATSLGVTTPDGIVGIVRTVNHQFSSVISLLNIEIRISASIENENYFGTITWDGKSYKSLSLSGIPIHANFEIGDKVVTNGYSTIFPEGLLIGTIASFDVGKDGAFFEIEVTPSTDFANLDHVYVLKDNFAADIISLNQDE